ncbi:16S rRNA (cytosine(1402)-N(4))-methyltransferase, partial [Candidatus Saccharibacteria bacterium 32-49-10]
MTSRNNMRKKPPQRALHHLEPKEQGDSTLKLHHIPVLLEQVVTLLAPRPGESYLDLTAGYGGHAREILARTNAPELMTLVDRDSNAIRELQTFRDKGAVLVQSDFASFTERAV